MASLGPGHISKWEIGEPCSNREGYGEILNFELMMDGSTEIDRLTSPNTSCTL
jgi:hypothetical protein